MSTTRRAFLDAQLSKAAAELRIAWRAYQRAMHASEEDVDRRLAQLSFNRASVAYWQGEVDKLAQG